MAQELDRWGLLRSLERIAFRRGLLVVNYHRIGAGDGNPFDDAVFSALPNDFESQVAYLQRHFRLLSLKELVDFSHKEFQFTECCALITFDDGYRDNFDVAYPILRKLGAPAVFFVPTDYIENPRLPWWDQIAYVVKKTERPVLSLKTDPPMSLDLKTTGRQKAVFEILQVFKSAKEANEAGFLSQLAEAAEVQVDRTALGRELFMTWDELNQMVKGGMSIGSHTHTHQILSQLSEADQRKELLLSRDILQERLKQPVTSVSYPVGRCDMFTATTKRLCRELGYTLGFSFHRGNNRPGQTDPLDIKRLGINSTDTASLSRSRIVFTTSFGRTF